MVTIVHFGHKVKPKLSSIRPSLQPLVQSRTLAKQHFQQDRRDGIFAQKSLTAKAYLGILYPILKMGWDTASTCSILSVYSVRLLGIVPFMSSSLSLKFP